MGDRPLILISNDDGIGAAGLLALAQAMRAFADVFVVAPEEEHSAKSHAITLTRPLRHRQVGPDIHAIDGTPADCVYVALYRDRLLPRRPDLVVSGINHGLNLGTDVFYSGTVAAAREASLRGIPAIAFSLASGGDFDAAAEIAGALAGRFLKIASSPETPLLLNINFPLAAPLGTRLTRLGRRLYDEDVVVRKDPRGREYYWIGGPGAHHEPLEGSDTDAIDAGFVSVTPLIIDLSHSAYAEFAVQLLASESADAS